MHKFYFQSEKEPRLSGEIKRTTILDDKMRALLTEFRLAATDLQNKASETCVFSETEQHTTKRMCGAVKDIGDGNADKGIDISKDAIRFVEHRKGVEEELGKKGLFTVFGIIITAICYAIWKAIKG